VLEIAIGAAVDRYSARQSRPARGAEPYGVTFAPVVGFAPRRFWRAKSAKAEGLAMVKLAIGLALGIGLSGAVAAHAAGMKLTSGEIKNGATIANAQVFKGFGCTGDNISPSLSWSGAPTGTKSFAVTIYDPDAPIGSGWWHWVVFNIPPGTTSLPKKAPATPAKI
jgi:hypothetical protein